MFWLILALAIEVVADVVDLPEGQNWQLLYLRMYHGASITDSDVFGGVTAEIFGT